MSRVGNALVAGLLAVAGVVPAVLDVPARAAAAPAVGHPSVTVTAALRGQSRTLRDLPPATSRPVTGGPLPLHLKTGAGTSHAPVTTAVTPADQTTAGTRTALPVQTGFDAASYADFGTGHHYAPPDNNSDVGPTAIVEMVNTGVAVYGKDGAVKAATRLVSDLFASSTVVGGAGSTACATRDDGDPVVRYDPLANRWVLSQFAIPTAFNQAGPNYECVAVSQTGDPTGAYWLYAFPDSNGWAPDYPKLGVWTDAYYVTFNEFSRDFTTNEGTRSCALDRTSMLKGLSATQQCFNLGAGVAGANTLLPADLDGSVPPPPGAPNYEVSVDPYHDTSTLFAWAFHVNWSAPASSTFTELASMPVAGYAMLCAADDRQACVPQLGSTNVLESLGDRMMFALSYRNFGDHQSLLAVHSVTDAGTTSAGGERWYELRVGTDGNLSVYQSGTYAPGDGLYRFMGSMAMDQGGDAALGFSVSSGSVHPSIRLTARSVSDPSGTMGYAETDVLDGAHSESGVFSNGEPAGRWGDYTSMNVDPSDDCTFWYTNQVYLQDDTTSWGTHIASVRLPRCASHDFAVSVPAGTVGGRSASIPVTTSQTLGTGSSATIRVNGPAGMTGGAGSLTTGGSKTVSVNTSGLKNGSYRIRVIVHSAFAVHSKVLTLLVDHVKPTASLSAPTAPFVLGPSTTVRWSGADTGGSGLAYYQLESRHAPYSGGFTAWALASTHYTGTSVSAGGLARGTTYCWRVRAVDKAGNAGAWSAQRCTAVPLDDTQTTASSGWTTLSGSGYWNGSLRRSTTLNTTLTRTGARADRLAVVVTKCSTCGDIDVYIGSTKVGRVYALSSTTAYRQVVVLPAFTAATGTVTLKVVTSGKPVFVDGVGISQG